ncbi:hypothetical protein EYF80_000509 [Liparis tanakae]|uniref:Uncharacterized protein n=1 Tax=Liparis tanakae TaxID=230148 RepID=A0A4Z2JGY0_9TELE|nr:hypothetical protein EYF80_000509 [Liparis tanakae]
MLNSCSFSFSELLSLRSVISRSESDSGSSFTPPLLSVGVCRPVPAPAPRPMAASPRPSAAAGGLASALSPNDAPVPTSVRPNDRLPGAEKCIIHESLGPPLRTSGLQSGAVELPLKWFWARKKGELAISRRG